ncbi:MAG: sensor histidine kinase [Bacillota bacterium]
MGTIRSRLATTYIVLIAAAMLVVGAVLANYWSSLYLRDTQATLMRQTELARGTVTDVLAYGPVRSARLDSAAAEIGRALNVRVTVIAVDGTVLADNENPPGQMENHAGRPEVIAALTSGQGAAVRPSATMRTEMLYTAIRVNGLGGTTAGVVRLAVPLSAIDAAVSRFWWIIVAAALVVTGLAAGMAFFVAGRLSRPIEEMTDTATRLASGDFSARPPLAAAGLSGAAARRAAERGYEVARLAMALEHMREMLRSRVDELTAAKGRFEAVLFSMANPVVMTDRTGRIIIGNPAAEKAFGAGGPLAGRDVLAAVRSPELADRMEEVAATGESQLVAIGLFDPDRWYNVSLGPVRGDAGEVTAVVAVFSDVSAMRQVERLRRDFVANVSHELLTPLTAVRGFAETLLEGADDDPAARRDFIKIMHNEADRMVDLVEDLLQLSRLESGRVEMRPAELDAAAVVDEVGAVLRPPIEAGGLTFENAVPRDLGPVVADRELLRRVFMNLIGNAVKYTPAGGRIAVTGLIVDFEPGLGRRLARAGGGAAAAKREARFAVVDTGVGIPAEDLPRVFERFYRVGKDRSRASGGTGLGLAIVKHIVEAHGGRVWAESEPGKGSQFWFTLPA